MDIDFAFICDYAEVGNKVNALGIGFDSIYAPEVPYTLPHMHLVAQARASVTEAGDKQITIRLIDADGLDVFPEISGTFNVPRPPEGATESIGRIGVALNNVVFPRHSQYSLHVVIQGTEMVRIPLRVVQPPATA